MILYNSRYKKIEVATLKQSNGLEVRYLRRRFLPPASPDRSFEYSIVQGDRLDNLTASFLGNPELFWRMCDDNNAMHPNEITSTIGRTIWLPML